MKDEDAYTKLLIKSELDEHIKEVFKRVDKIKDEFLANPSFSSGALVTTNTMAQQAMASTDTDLRLDLDELIEKFEKM